MPNGSTMNEAQETPSMAELLAEHCDSLISSWHQIGQQASAGASPGSPMFDETARVRRSYPDLPKNIEYAASQFSGEFVGAISLLLQSIATQLRAQPLVSISIWPLIRAELEYAGRIAWMLEPLQDSDVGLRRIARASLELLASLQREKYTANKHSKPLSRDRKKQRDDLLAQIRSIFDDVATPMETPSQIENWTIGGQQMMSLGKANDLFLKLNFESNKAIYDSLSDYSHPSVTALTRQSVAVESRGVTFRSYPQDVDLLDYQVRLGCLILYKAAYSIANYYGLDTEPLERWDKAAPQHWFDGK